MSKFDRAEMQRLHQKAVQHLQSSQSAKCVWLYRNKAPSYFSEIDTQHGGLMKVILKDNGGDPRSPINSQLSGLFFYASVNPGSGSESGEPITDSPFGSSRLLVPAEILLGMATNLYFADFFCLQSDYHYITLVMTRQWSAADTFCSRHLVKLELRQNSDNPFFFRDSSSGELRVNARYRQLIEIFFTEDLDLNYIKQRGAVIKENISTFGRGSSTPGGLPKKSYCSTCNL